jgi:membrane protein DedA with SNARE-associated domain
LDIFPVFSVFGKTLFHFMREWMTHNGIFGVAVLMLLQNILPILPSEVIMPLAGFMASMGYFKLHVAILVGMGGSLLGHLPWYFLGLRLGEKRMEDFAERHGKWLRVRRVHMVKAENWFSRNEAKAVLLGRLVPGLRTYVNVPAGATRMAFLPFLFYTVVGEAVWTTALALAGYLLGRDYELVAGYVHLFLIVPLVLGAGYLLYRRHLRHRRDRRRTA